MGFYDLSKKERIKLVEQLNQNIYSDIQKNVLTATIDYFSDKDTYIRKSAYQAIGKIYNANNHLQPKVISSLEKMITYKDPKIRQTTINSTGEIGIKDFEAVEHFFDKGLFDQDHSVRNAVIGSIKKMGEKNTKPVLTWAKKYLTHPDKEIRREICHGIELRGRTYPQDILPLLKELQHEKTARVRNTLIHVLGQISYKKRCLAIVIEHLNTWNNKALTDKGIKEIIDIHDRYRNFAFLTQDQAIDYIKRYYKK